MLASARALRLRPRSCRAVFASCGQVCLGTGRVCVERPIFDRFVAALKAKAESFKLGRPEDAATGLGPGLIEPAGTPLE